MKKIIIFLTILISTIFSNVAFADVIVPWQNCHDYDKVCYNECMKPLIGDEYEKYERYKKYKLENNEFKKSLKEVRIKLKKIAKENYSLKDKNKLKEKLKKDLELKYNIIINDPNENSYDKEWKCKEECCIKEKKYCTNSFCSCTLKWNNWPVCKNDPECKWDCTDWEKFPIKVNFIIYKIFWVILILLIIFVWIFIYKRKKSKKW